VTNYILNSIPGSYLEVMMLPTSLNFIIIVWRGKVSVINSSGSCLRVLSCFY